MAGGAVVVAIAAAWPRGVIGNHAEPQTICHRLPLPIATGTRLSSPNLPTINGGCAMKLF